MDLNKLNLDTITKEASKVSQEATEMLQKAGKTAGKLLDQDGDGDFDMKDAAILAGKAEKIAKETISAVKTEAKGIAETIKKL